MRQMREERENDRKAEEEKIKKEEKGEGRGKMRQMREERENDRKVEEEKGRKGKIEKIDE